MELKKYNQNLITELNKSQLLTELDIDKLNKCMPTIKHSIEFSQMFRTDTEARTSVLNDVKFPTVDAKYWQSVRELGVQSTELFYLNFEYKNKLIDVEELEAKLKTDYESEFDRKRDEIELEKHKFDIIQMQKNAKNRIREVDMWAGIIEELKPHMKHSKEDVNEHQLISNGYRFVNELITHIKGNAQYSPSEARNAFGLIQTTLSHIEKVGKLEEFKKNLPQDYIQFLQKQKMLK